MPIPIQQKIMIADVQISECKETQNIDSSHQGEGFIQETNLFSCSQLN